MHVGRKRASRLQSAIERVADPAREIAGQATDTASRVATDVTKKSADLGSQVGERMNDVVHVIAQEGHALLEQREKNVKDKSAKGKKPRKHRLRKVALLTGIGAVAAYLLDPQNGSERRAAARRSLSTSAQVVGDSLDRGAHAAHQAADVTATTSGVASDDPRPGLN